METYKNFTYGVEIEGLFKTKLLKELKKKTLIELKQDGSVHESRIFHIIHDKDKKEIEQDITEINTGIFTKQDKMLDTLKLLKNNENYFCDASCGLHLHIAPKRDFGYLRGKIEYYRFIKKLQKYATI